MLSKRLTLRACALPLLVAALCGPLRAAELGEVKVNSHVGQQLSADIELVDLTAADLADLQAKLANPDVFQGAGLTVPPGMYIAVARRDNKRFLHLTTLQPVNAEALHIFLELNSGGRQVIRAVSLWLTPEPASARVAKTAPVSVAIADSGEAGLSEAAQRAFAHRKQVAMAQAQAAASGQPPLAASDAAAPLALAPAAAASAARSPATASALPVSAPPQRVTPKRAMPPVAAPPPPPPAAACAPAQQVEAQLQQCQSMTSKLVDIEGKVKRLQTALEAPQQTAAIRAAAPAVPPKAETIPSKPEAAPAKPAAAATKPGAVPLKPGVAADLAGKPRSRLIMLVGGVLAGLAALGGLFYFLRKRQAKGPLQIWQSFRKKGEATAQEPTLAEPEEVAAQ